MEENSLIDSKENTPPENPSVCIWMRVFDKYKEPNIFNLYNPQLLAKYSSNSSCYGYIAVAVMALVSSFYLNWRLQKFTMRKFIPKLSYRFFEVYILAVHLRVLMPKLCYLHKQYEERYTDAPESTNCEYCAFVETFFDIFEVEMLTHFCIERYVVAKYISRGWPINKKHYVLYFLLSMFFAILYSNAPSLGVGDYGLDFDCKSCVFDMILPTDWTRYAVVIVWLLRSVKPVAFMLIMLYWTTILQLRYTGEINDAVLGNVYLNHIAAGVVFVYLTSWAPIAITRAHTIFVQLFYEELTAVPLGVIQFAVICSEMSPILLTAGILMGDTLFTQRHINEDSTMKKYVRDVNKDTRTEQEHNEKQE